MSCSYLNYICEVFFSAYLCWPVQVLGRQQRMKQTYPYCGGVSTPEVGVLR